MDLSAVGRAVLIAREGRRLEAYRDSVGVWTIGIGHTAAAGPPIPRAGLRIDAAEADAIFVRDVAAFVRTVAEALPEPLPQHAFDALVSLCFNIGPAAFRRSTVLRRLRAGDRMGAGEAILMWNRPRRGHPPPPGRVRPVPHALRGRPAAGPARRRAARLDPCPRSSPGRPSHRTARGPPQLARASAGLAGARRTDRFPPLRSGSLS
ncbi:lysozyme [Methylorubrum thiocyanatum]